MRRLNEINITRIAFVDKGANNKDFALFKSFEQKKENKNHKKGVNKMKFAKYFQAEKVNIEKIDIDTIDEVVSFLAGLEDPDAAKVAELLTAVKTKYADKMTAPAKDGGQMMDSAEAETVTEMETKKFSKPFIDGIKETFATIKNMRKAIKEVKPEAEAIKKFEDENREATEAEITEAFSK